MFERFTDRARKVMAMANQEAQRLNHEYIGTEHILLGLVKEGSGVGATVLKNLEVDLKRLRLEVEKLVQSGPEIVTVGKLPQTPRAKTVIEYAIQEACSLNHNYVGTEHILLGLVRETNGRAAKVLMNIGLTLERIRSEVLNLLGVPDQTSDADPSLASHESRLNPDKIASSSQAEATSEWPILPPVGPPYHQGRQGDGVRHIVIWRLKDHAEGATKAENALKVKAQLEGLTRVISQIRHLEVGINQNPSEAAYDVVLYSEFGSQVDLEAYQRHPEHLRVAEFIEKVREERRVVDYTLELTASRGIRDLLLSRQTVVSPGVYDAASAKLFERVTRCVIQCSGYGMAVSACLTDESELTLIHNLKITRLIVSGVQGPVVADGQDGYGGTDQTAETVRQFVQAGVAGISLADYVRGGGRVIAEARMIEKLEAARRAAVAVGKPDLVIIARTDALGLGSNRNPQMEKVIHRANAYLKAGADVVFVAYIQTLDEVRRLVQEIKGPVSVAAGIPYNIRQFNLRDLMECGVAWVSLPSLAIQAALGGIDRSMRLVLMDGGFQALMEENLLYPMHCEE